MNVTHVERPWLGRDKRTSASQGALVHHVYRTFQEASHLKDDWNNLALRTGDILCSYDWCEIWWTHFGRWRRLEIHTLHDGSRLVAVLPLFRETIRPAGVWLRTVRVLSCDYTGGTVGLAVESAFAETFVHSVLEKLEQDGPWDILQIGALRGYNTVAEPMADAFARSAHVGTVIVGREDNWGTMFELPATYEAFLGSLPGKSRTEINRRERQLREKHQVDVEVVSASEQVQPALGTMIELHQKRWTDRGQPGRFGAFAAVEDFHRELADRLAPRGQLMLLALKVDGQIVSVTYGYHFGSRTLALFGSHSYDEQWQRYGLGRIMYTYLIRHAIARGKSVVDDGMGVFEHKLSLGGQLHGERSLVVVRRGWSSHLRFWAALRTSYLIHALYSRIWTDMIAPRLGVLPKGRHFHVRYGVLAQIFRRVHFRLFGCPTVLETRCPNPRPPASPAKI